MNQNQQQIITDYHIADYQQNHRRLSTSRRLSHLSGSALRILRLLQTRASDDEEPSKKIQKLPDSESPESPAASVAGSFKLKEEVKEEEDMLNLLGGIHTSRTCSFQSSGANTKKPTQKLDIHFLRLKPTKTIHQMKSPIIWTSLLKRARFQTFAVLGI